MKKILIIILAMVLIFSGCSGDIPETEGAKSGGWLLTDEELAEANSEAGNSLESRPDEYICYLYIDCKMAINYGKREVTGFKHLPEDGIIYEMTELTYTDGETVFELLARVTKEKGIQLEYNGTGGLQYIEGIDNLYEFDCGSLSGWTYTVNGWSPNYGCGQYKIERGDVIRWEYTCNLGEDVGSKMG